MKRLLVIFVVLLFFTGLIIYLVSQNKNKSNFRIDDLYLRSVVLGNQTFTFDHGKVTNRNGGREDGEKGDEVKKVVAFYAMTREDPILSLSSSQDLAGYEKSINLVKEQKAELVKLIGKDIPLYPLSFLETVIETTKAERKFLSSPSVDSAKKLIFLYKKNLNSYSQTSKNFIDFMDKNSNKVMVENIINFDSFFSKKTMYKDIHLISKNYEALNREVYLREECLVKGIGCTRPKFSMPEVINTAQPKPTSLLSLDILFPLQSADERKTVEGPFAIRTGCWGWGKGFDLPKRQIYVLPSQREKIMDISIHQFKLGEDNFYRTITIDMPGDKPRDPFWTVKIEGQMYLCSTQEYQVQAENFIAFVKLFKNKPLLANSTNKKFKKLEQEILKGNNKDIDSLMQLADIYAYEYSNSSDEQLRQKLIDRYLAIKRETFGLEEIYNELALLIHREARILYYYKHVKDYYLILLVPNRSFWDLFYLPFSRSFWKTVSPKYLDRAKVNPPLKNYYGYREMLKKMSPEEIKKIHLETLQRQKDFVGKVGDF